MVTQVIAKSNYWEIGPIAEIEDIMNSLKGISELSFKISLATSTQDGSLKNVKPIVYNREYKNFKGASTAEAIKNITRKFKEAFDIIQKSTEFTMKVTTKLTYYIEEKKFTRKIELEAGKRPIDFTWESLFVRPSSEAKKEELCKS